MNEGGQSAHEIVEEYPGLEEERHPGLPPLRSMAGFDAKRGASEPSVKRAFALAGFPVAESLILHRKTALVAAVDEAAHDGVSTCVPYRRRCSSVVEQRFRKP